MNSVITWSARSTISPLLRLQNVKGETAGGEGSWMMSRRRKHGEFPGLKKTPRKAAAVEEYSLVESGKRRLRSDPGSGLALAGEGPLQPGVYQEQPPPVASCSKSHPEEKYQTPKRMLKMDLLSSAFGSPNDPDGQSDIFWDQNSPMTKQLGKGRKKPISITDTDEISHIVSRIAPQDEKPTTDSMLGVWIGATAIPCTPNVAKGKSRTKLSCTKLKIQSQEEELMKLAKQFDKNMEELGVIKDQDNINHDVIQITSDADTLNTCKDAIQIQLYDRNSEIDNAVNKCKPIKENTDVPVADDTNSSQKSFDQNAEAALNAIFDGSTQKCSGQLSQESSHTFSNTSNSTVEKKNSLKEEKTTTGQTLATEKLANKTPESLSYQLSTPIVTKSSVTSDTKGAKTFNKHINTNNTSDFEDDWENLLYNDPFVMQNTKVTPVPKTSQIANPKSVYTFNSKNEKNNSRTKTSLEARLTDSKTLQVLHSAVHNSELTDAGKCLLSGPDDKSNKSLSTVNKLRFDRSMNKIIVENKFQASTIASSLTKVSEDLHTGFTSNAAPSGKKSGLCTEYSNEQKSRPISNQSFKEPANEDYFDFAISDNKSSVCNPNQTSASKLDSFFDDWNDPSFTNEIFKTCHQLENKWEVDDVDDDLLYQACDDVEKLTQQQDIGKHSRASENILESNNNSVHGAKSMCATSKGESRLVQSNHLNLSSGSEQTSLTKTSQVSKSLKMQKKEISGNYSSVNASTNLTMNSSNCQSSNLAVSWNNSDGLTQMSTSKSILKESSSLSGSSGNLSKEVTIYKNNLNTQHLPYRIITSGPQNDLNKTVKFSKYTFTKVKNSQVLSQVNQNHVIGSISDTKITQGVEKNEAVNTHEETIQQKSLLKLPESLKQPSKGEDKNRKYSPEEIQRKRQEALVRRMAKTQTSSLRTNPT